MRTLVQDIRYGLRVLAQTPGVTAVAVLTLALGIGANTAIFSLVNAVLVRPLKYRDAERLVMLWENAASAGSSRDTPAPANYFDWKSQQQSFEAMAATRQQTFDLTGDGEPEKLLGFGVESGFFDVLGVGPARGRALLP